METLHFTTCKLHNIKSIAATANQLFLRSKLLMGVRLTRCKVQCKGHGRLKSTQESPEHYNTSAPGTEGKHAAKIEPKLIQAAICTLRKCSLQPGTLS